MKELIDISKVNLKSVTSLMKNDDGDELYINMMAYHLQQAAELYIKHHLESEGIRYPLTHNIDELLRLGNIPNKYLLEPFADILTLWEAKTRHVKDYIASRDTVMRVYDTLRYIINGERATWPTWFNNLSLEQKAKLKELNSVAYNCCVAGSFDDVEVLLEYLKPQVEV